MLTPYMLADHITIGKGTLVYVFTIDRFARDSRLFELRPDLRASLGVFVSTYSGSFEPFHVFTEMLECSAFIRPLNEIAEKYFGGDLAGVYLRYEQTLREQGIDIRWELLKAANLGSDQDAIDHLNRLNMKLRLHLDNFPQYHDNPVRLPGQRGALRKPKNISPIYLKWP